MKAAVEKSHILWFLFTLILWSIASEGWAKVYLTSAQSLKLAFPEADTIDKQTVMVSAEERTRIQKKAKSRVTFSKMDIYVGMNGEKPLGYAMIHHVKGKSRPISFMAVITPDGKIDRVEILAYRESHGGEIRYPSFLKQFIGKTLEDPIRNKRDIMNISGATISCRALADGVRTLLAFWEEVIQ